MNRSWSNLNVVISLSTKAYEIQNILTNQKHKTRKILQIIVSALELGI